MEEIDLKELIGMFLEKKFLIILVVVLFAILGAVYTTHFITPLYESSTSLVLVQTGAESNSADSSIAMSESITTTDITLNSKLVDAYAVVAKSKRVASKVVDNLKLNISSDELKKMITISSASDTQNLKVTVKHVNPEQACKIANEVAKVFIEEVVEIYKVENLYVLDPAEVNSLPCNVNLTKNIIIFAFVGGILVAGYILLINMLDTTVKTDTDIEKAIAVPVLASIVLTEDSNKKKINRKTNSKTSGKTNKKTETYDSTVQFFYENNVNTQRNDEENDSLFSYVTKKDLEEKPVQTTGTRHKKKTKKGGN